MTRKSGTWVVWCPIEMWSAAGKAKVPVRMTPPFGNPRRSEPDCQRTGRRPYSKNHKRQEGNTVGVAVHISRSRSMCDYEKVFGARAARSAD